MMAFPSMAASRNLSHRAIWPPIRDPAADAGLPHEGRLQHIVAGRCCHHGREPHSGRVNEMGTGFSRGRPSRVG